MSKPKVIVADKYKSPITDLTVVSLKWINAHCHRFIMSDGKIFEIPKIIGIGVRSANPSIYGGPWCWWINGKAYLNRVPEPQLIDWAMEHNKWLRSQVAKNPASSPFPNPTMNSPGEKSSKSGKQLPLFSSSTEEQAMKVKQVDVVALFEAMTYTTAGKWSPKRLADKVKTLPSLVDEDTKIEDEASAKLLKKLLKAVAAEEEIEIIGEDDGDEDAAEETPKAKSKKSKEKEKKADKGKKSKDEDDDEDDDDSDSDDDESDDEDEDEEEEKPAKKGKKADKGKAAKADKKADKKTGKGKKDEESVPVHKKKTPIKAGKKGVGVIATIIEELRKANEKKPTTKERILATLVKKFPDREEKAMKSTISSQIPSGLKTEKGLVVESNDKGYWLPAEK